MAISKVIVVGAGPAGLILALLLAKEGINVLVLDAASKLDEQPRATHYSPPATHELRRAGVLDDVLARGYVPAGVMWRKIDGTPLGGISGKDVPLEDKMVCLPLNSLTRLIMEHFEKQPKAELRWSHKVTANIGQNDKNAWVMVETPSGEQKFEADYIVGCDGANSQIRRALYGEMGFPGRTWDEQIVATNVYYDMTPYGWGDASFIIDPEHWSMVSKIQTDGLLRITYGDIPGLTREEYIARQPMKFQKFLPGNPSPDKYKIVSISPYKVHQRCAESLRVGRFLLVADAAHLCNPFGGLGLTGGLVDAGNLFDCLNGIHKGLADDNILSRYDEVRRHMYHNVIDPISSENLRRLWQDPDKVLEEDKFLEICRRAETDPELSRQLQTGIRTIMHDFTTEYKVKPNGVHQSSQPAESETSYPSIPIVVAGDA